MPLGQLCKVDLSCGSLKHKDDVSRSWVLCCLLLCFDGAPRPRSSLLASRTPHPLPLFVSTLLYITAAGSFRWNIQTALLSLRLADELKLVRQQ
ncbi:hypothetical protein MHYP_G00268630 [Metynnis hypsauchen]